MLITTTNSIQGKEITHYIGIVTDHKYVNIYKSKGLSFKDSLSAIKGYENAEKELESTKKEALERIIEKAKSLHATAVVGLTMDVEVLREGMTLAISVMGTAVTHQ